MLLVTTIFVLLPLVFDQPCLSSELSCRIQFGILFFLSNSSAEMGGVGSLDCVIGIFDEQLFIMKYLILILIKLII